MCPLILKVDPIYVNVSKPWILLAYVDLQTPFGFGISFHSCMKLEPQFKVAGW